jgi:hypothetical protein
MAQVFFNVTIPNAKRPNGGFAVRGQRATGLAGDVSVVVNTTTVAGKALTQGMVVSALQEAVAHFSSGSPDLML